MIVIILKHFLANIKFWFVFRLIFMTNFELLRITIDIYSDQYY